MFGWFRGALREKKEPMDKPDAYCMICWASSCHLLLQGSKHTKALTLYRAGRPPPPKKKKKKKKKNKNSWKGHKFNLFGKMRWTKNHARPWMTDAWKINTARWKRPILKMCFLTLLKHIETSQMVYQIQTFSIPWVQTLTGWTKKQWQFSCYNIRDTHTWTSCQYLWNPMRKLLKLYTISWW